jgi:hypothetical protein
VFETTSSGWGGIAHYVLFRVGSPVVVAVVVVIIHCRDVDFIVGVHVGRGEGCGEVSEIINGGGGGARVRN